MRKDFPTLHQEVNGKPLVYLDSAATSQKPQVVHRHARGLLPEHDNANVHRGIHELSRRATVAYEEARAKVAGWVGAASDPSEIIWTRGTTEAINLVAPRPGASTTSGEGDEILLTVMEHHSNLVPWQILAHGAPVREAPLHRAGRAGADSSWTTCRGLLSEQHASLVAMSSHVSNALGHDQSG